MNKIILTITCLTALLSANAQPPTLAWAKQLGGIGGGFGSDIAVDATGNIVVVGGFKDTADFDPGPGVFNLISSGSFDIFVGKLGAAGALIWAKKIGSTDYDDVASVAIDNAGNIYITGGFEGVVDFDPGAATVNMTSDGASDVFVAKLDPSGNFLWAKQFGSTGDFDRGYALAVDASGNCYTIGIFEYTVDFDPGAGASNLTSAGGDDIFISKLDPAGDFIWVKQFGGVGAERGLAIDLDNAGNAYTAGYFSDTADFDPALGTSFNLTNDGMGIFISKLDANGSFVWAKQFHQASEDGEAYGKAIAVDGAGNVYTTGSFFDTVDFNPGAAAADTFHLAAMGEHQDVFISKLDANGNFVWANRFGGNIWDEGGALDVDNVGNVYVTGYYNFNIFAGTDAFFAKLDGAGDFEWTVSLNRVDPGSVFSVAGASIVADAANNVYTTGYFGDTAVCDLTTGSFQLITENGGGTNEAFVLKFSQSPDGISSNSFSNNLVIQPNPSPGQFNISTTTVKLISVDVYNSLGALVEKQIVTGKQYSIDISHQPAGLYMVLVKNDAGVIATEKIVKH